MKGPDLLAYLEMLEDEVRVDAYRRAIERDCPGKVVIDLGAGMGILSHLALAAGAEKVFAIEVDRDALMVGYKLAKRMGYGDRFVPLLAPSTAVDLPLAADVLVSETFDSFGFGEGGIGFIRDAKERLCKPDAFVIPRGIDVYLGLGGSSDLRALHSRLAYAGIRVGLGGYHHIHEELPPVALAMQGDLVITELEKWFSLRLGAEDFPRESTFKFRAHLKGLVDAIIGHFYLDMGDGLYLASPRARPETHWRRGVMPLPQRLHVEAGQALELSLSFSEPDARGQSRFSYSLTSESRTDERPWSTHLG